MTTRRRKSKLDRLLYGYQHQQLRRRLLPGAVGSLCSRCGKVILRGDAVELDHKEGTVDSYRGFAHAACNRSAGGRTRQGMDPKARTVTQW